MWLLNFRSSQDVYVWACVEDRGQRTALESVLSFLYRGLEKLNSGHQTCTASLFTRRAILLTQPSLLFQ